MRLTTLVGFMVLGVTQGADFKFFLYGIFKTVIISPQPLNGFCKSKTFEASSNIIFGKESAENNLKFHCNMPTNSLLLTVSQLSRISK